MKLVGTLDVSRETLEKLERFSDLVGKWSKSINLVGKSTVSDSWNRHIIDSAQLFMLAPAQFKTWLDIGSGGGLPGIVIAILAEQLNPNARITLVESDQRKAQFLRTARRTFGLDIEIFAERIEEIPPLASDIVSARALGDLSQLLSFACKHGSASGVALFPKGRRYSEEIRSARNDWSFDVVARASMTDNEAKVLVVREIKRVHKQP